MLESMVSVLDEGVHGLFEPRYAVHFEFIIDRFHERTILVSITPCPLAQKS